MKHIHKIFIAIIFVSTLTAVVFMIFFREKTKEEAGSIFYKRDSDTETEAPPPVSEGDKIFEVPQSNTEKMSAVQYIFFVADGDLWRSESNGSQQIKLIDRDTVREVEIFPDGKHIAYTIAALRDENVIDWTGVKGTRSIEHRQLLLADEMGSNSILVQEFVDRWGLIPKSNLLWYETSSLKEIFEWGYAGGGDIWIYDIDTRKKFQLVKPSPSSGLLDGLLTAVWSPDGSKVLYINKNGVLSQTERVSQKEKDIMKLPWIGGDRGGPAPVPQFFWSQDSQYIYSAFTPVVSQNQKDDKNFDRFIDGHLNVFKISRDGSSISLLLDGGSAPITNDESYPGVVFNRDRSRIVFLRYSENRVKELDIYEWLYPRDDISAPIPSLVFYDLEKGREVVLEKDFDYFRYYYNLGFHRGEIAMDIDENYVFIFVGDRDQDKVFFRQYDINSGRILGESKIISPGDAKYFQGRENAMQNILFSPEDGKVYFQRGSFLYTIDVGSEHDAEIIIQGVENVAYQK